MSLARTSLTAVLALCLCHASARAQESGRRVYDEELRVKLDEQGLEARDSGVDGGGWFNFALFKFDDAQADRFRTLRHYELRAWASANLQGVHKAYVRGLFSWDDWNSGDDTLRAESDSARIERAWYQFSLGRMLANRTGGPLSWDLRVKVGREYATIGTGLVLAMPLDMVQMDLRLPGWEVTALLGKTLADTPNIDSSPAVFDHQQRCFYGGQVTYTGLTHHRPFVYFLGQEDHTNPQPKQWWQAYGYSSRYLGAGSTGNLFLPELRYQAELVWESGGGYSYWASRSDGRDDICAVGMDALLEYSWRVATHPQFMVEFMRGSGDADRRSSATSTIGGNLLGTRDSAFNAFGFRDTGVAFAPALANLNIYVAGASFKPLENVKLLKNMRVGTKVFFYQKAVEEGAISDPTATRQSPWVGWEWDAYCDWRITSDLSWTIRYGAFQPGGAFEDRQCRQFVYTGVTLSF